MLIHPDLLTEGLNQNRPSQQPTKTIDVNSRYYFCLDKYFFLLEV